MNLEQALNLFLKCAKNNPHVKGFVIHQVGQLYFISIQIGGETITPPHGSLEQYTAILELARELQNRAGQ